MHTCLHDCELLLMNKENIAEKDDTPDDVLRTWHGLYLVSKGTLSRVFSILTIL